MNTEKERFEEKNDKFIRHNNEMKALKLAKKTLMDAISKEILKFDRSFLNNDDFSKGGRILILGRKNCALLLELHHEGIEAGEIEGDYFSKVPPKLTILNMPVYVSSKDYEIRIMDSFGAYQEESDLFTEDERGGPYKWTPSGVLFKIDEWIDKLPESSKLKKVSEEG